LGKIAVVKEVERSDDWSRLQPVEVERKQKQEDVRLNLLFIIHRFSFFLPKNRWLYWILVITLCVLLGATLALITPLWSNRDTLNPGQRFPWGNAKLQNSDLLRNNSQSQLSRPVNILVMGIDPLPGASNTLPKIFTGSSYTMLLLRLDPDKSMRVLSIPGDSMVVIPGVGLAKISLANARGGSALAARTVSRTLNNVPIDRYVRITINAFEELVDLLGGVEVFVPERMSYKDATQQLEIDLDPGWQTLNGNQAQQFVRFRDSEMGDVARVQRQQALLKALRDRLTSPAVVPYLPKLTRIMHNYVDTNLSPAETLALVNFCTGLEQKNFQMVLLPGSLSPLSKDPSSYWLDPVGQDLIMGKYFGVNSVGVLQKMRPLSTLRIAIQNASGQPKLGKRVAKYLKDQGFENVYIVSDWSDRQHQTEIIVQRGNLEAAADLKKILGLGNIEASSTGDLESHLTIRVGKDWDNQIHG
jgi:LCP family protein required for cell wall assembly